MNKLVLAALVAAASSAGCTTTESTRVTMSWSFEHVDSGGRGQCPAGYDTAQLIAQPVDTSTHVGFGTTFVDQFDCVDGVGTSRLPDGVYLVWVEIVDGNDTTRLFAKSEEVYYDTLDGNANLAVKFLDDGGYFSFTWDLVDASNRVVSCRDAGVVGGDTSIGSLATSISNADYFKLDTFDCEDHFGVTEGLRVGTYTVSIDADDGSTNHPAPTITNAKIKANFVTFLGDIDIPID
jgi:hypothetical protein